MAAHAADAHGRGVAALVQVDGAGVPGPGVAALLLEHLEAVLDQAAHLLGALEPVVRVLGEGAHDQAVQLRRRRVGDLGGRDRLVLDVLVDHRERRLAGERGPQRQQLVEEAAGGVEVRAVVDGLAERLLRGEVLGGAHHHAGLRHRRLGAVQGAGDAEVHDLDGAGVGDDDVGRLDVAVDDAVLVAVGERLQDTGDDDERLLRAGRLRVDQQVADGVALDDLHHDVGDGAVADPVLARVVDRDHRVVVEARDRLRLTREARLGDGVLRQVRAEQLHSDGPAEPDVLGREDLRHTAPAESARQPVTAVANETAVAPQFRRVMGVRHVAASRLGVGRALSALRLCHRSSPSCLDRHCPRARVRTPGYGDTRSRPESRAGAPTGHATAS